MQYIYHSILIREYHHMLQTSTPFWKDLTRTRKQNLKSKEKKIYYYFNWHLAWSAVGSNRQHEAAKLACAWLYRHWGAHKQKSKFTFILLKCSKIQHILHSKIRTVSINLYIKCFSWIFDKKYLFLKTLYTIFNNLGQNSFKL